MGAYTNLMGIEITRKTRSEENVGKKAQRRNDEEGKRPEDWVFFLRRFRLGRVENDTYHFQTGSRKKGRLEPREKTPDFPSPISRPREKTRPGLRKTKRVLTSFRAGVYQSQQKEGWERGKPKQGCRGASTQAVDAEIKKKTEKTRGGKKVWHVIKQVKGGRDEGGKTNLGVDVVQYRQKRGAYIETYTQKSRDCKKGRGGGQNLTAAIIKGKRDPQEEKGKVRVLITIKE